MANKPDLRKVNRPFGPITRAVVVDIGTDDFIDLDGFQFVPQATGTLTVRLVNAEPTDADIGPLTATAGEMFSLGGKDTMFSKVVADGTVGSIIVCYQ